MIYSSSTTAYKSSIPTGGIQSTKDPVTPIVSANQFQTTPVSTQSPYYSQPKNIQPNPLLGSQRPDIPQSAYPGSQTLMLQPNYQINYFQQVRPQSQIQVTESPPKPQILMRSQTYSNLPSDSHNTGPQLPYQPYSHNLQFIYQGPNSSSNSFNSKSPFNYPKVPEFINPAQLPIEHSRPFSQVASPVPQDKNKPNKFINPSISNVQAPNLVIESDSQQNTNQRRNYHSEKIVSPFSSPSKQAYQTQIVTYNPLNDRAYTSKPIQQPAYSTGVKNSPLKSSKLPDPQKPQPQRQTPLPRQPGTSPSNIPFDHPYQLSTSPIQLPYKREGILPQRKEDPNIFSSPQAPFLLPSRTQAKYSGPLMRQNLPNMSRLWGVQSGEEDPEVNRIVDKTDDKGKRGPKIFQD